MNEKAIKYIGRYALKQNIFRALYSVDQKNPPTKKECQRLIKDYLRCFPSVAKFIKNGKFTH